MARRIASAVMALVLLAAGAWAAEPTLEEQLALIEEKVAAAEVWIWDVNYHEDAGFYAFDDARFQTWDTAIALWLYDWMAANGWDVSAFIDHVDNARAWLASVRHEEGFWSHFDNPDERADAEATAIGALVAPAAITDDWLVAGQQPDGYWNIGNPDIDWANYPSVTAHVLHTAACRDLPVDFESALAWLDAVPNEGILPGSAYYKTRFYITYLAAAVAAVRDDFPEDLAQRMRVMIGYFQDADGSFEGRAMDDNPSAIVPTALAMQTALWLDDGSMDEAIRKAGLFLLFNDADDHWEGGLWGEEFDKNESLFATVHAVRALVMAHAWLSGNGDSTVVCSEPTQPVDDDVSDDDGGDDDADDDAGDDDAENDDQQDSDDDAGDEESGEGGCCG